jgi:hypothetical protein
MIKAIKRIPFEPDTKIIRQYPAAFRAEICGENTLPVISPSGSPDFGVE